LWILVGIAVLAGAVFISLSVGGVLALAGATVFLAIALVRKGFHWSRVLPFAIVVVLACALAARYGQEFFGSRWPALAQGSPAEKARLRMWSRVLSSELVGRCLLWGTGAGTFGYVEPLTRQAE